MKIALLSLLCALIGLTGCTTVPKSSAKAVVAFTNPEKFTDFKSSYSGSDKEREDLQKQFTEYLQGLVGYHLTDGQTLNVTFTNIDLAGDYEPWRNPSATDIRFYKEIYPPSMDFTYSVTDSTGKAVKEGSEHLRDLDYMMRVRIQDSDLLKYEKSMLDDWMRSNFRRPPSPDNTTGSR